MINALRENPLLQFTIVSFVIAFAISAVTFMTISNGAEETLGLLDAHGEAMRLGHAMAMDDLHSMPKIKESARRVQWLTLITVAGGLLGLYVSVVAVVWNGWRTISRQKSDMRRANEDLFDAQDRLSTILTSVGNGIYGIDLEDRITFVNPYALEKLGWRTEELLGKSSHSTLHVDAEGNHSHSEESCPIVETARTGVARWVAHETIFRKDGTALAVEYSVTPTKRGDEIIGGVVAFQDITDKLQSEMAVRESEERIRAVVEQMTDGLVTVDKDGCVVSFNSAAQKIFGYAADEIVGQKADLLISPQGESDKGNVFSGYIRNGNEDALELNDGILGRRRDGTTFPMDLSVSEVHLEEQNLIVSTVRDVTESRRLEEQTRQSLAEKEVLLKEIHHRVKNNLQLISSLLALQAGYIQDEDSKAIFKDSEQRVRSMALIHEKLYGSDDLTRVDFPGYLQSLVSELLRSYAPDPGTVSISLDVGDIAFGIDTAIPCGLIVSELVSNALKYAFPDGRSGEIKVSLNNDQDEHIMTVCDDGVGIPDDLDWENADSLGMQLIHTLTAQLGGTADLITDNGTEIKISFPNSDKSAQ